MITRTTYFRIALVCAALSALAVAVTSSPARDTNGLGVTIENFGKINDHYYRGSQPNQLEFAQLKRVGIKTVVDLRGDYKKAEEDWVRTLGMNYFRIPLKTKVAATNEQVSYFLSLVNNADNWPVYVHCKGGRHRTGAMTAIYRITHDSWSADQAYQEMKNYDFENGFFGGPGAQKKLVYSFYEHHRAAATGTAQK